MRLSTSDMDILFCITIYAGLGLIYMSLSLLLTRKKKLRAKLYEIYENRNMVMAIALAISFTIALALWPIAFFRATLRWMSVLEDVDEDEKIKELDEKLNRIP